MEQLEERYMFWRRKKRVFEEPRDEPLFVATPSGDSDMLRAYSQAASTVDELVVHLRRGGKIISAIKMRFRDPDQSARLGEDRFVFLWLSVESHDPEAGHFVVRFFEVPPDLQKWHRPGEQLVIERDQIFDWFVNDDGLLYGGYTMRVARSRMPEGERAAFDNYTGVRQWVDANRHT